MEILFYVSWVLCGFMGATLVQSVDANAGLEMAGEGVICDFLLFTLFSLAGPLFLIFAFFYWAYRQGQKSQK